MCCGVCVAACCGVLHVGRIDKQLCVRIQYVAAYCTALHCVAVCFRSVQRFAMWCRLGKMMSVRIQSVAVCCSVSQ